MGKVKEVYLRWAGIPLLGFGLSFIIKDHDHGGFWKNVLISVFFTAALWNASFLIIMYYRKKLSHIKYTTKRLIYTVIVISLVLTVGANVIGLMIGLCNLEQLSNPMFFFRHSHVNMMAGFMIASIYESSYFFNRWKESVVLNEELKNQQIRTQFEVLQNQMSPHFLFNSLNTLTTLIAEDQKVAINFTQTLSEVYRYILQNKERELVSLYEELEFSKSYVYLLKMRYPENLHVQFKIDSEFNEYHIAPLTLQMLIENAIKHNSVSKNEPLTIEVYLENKKAVVVKNNLQLKKSLEKSTKTGLANIRKRYAYLGKREIDVVTSTNHFIVAVPLIKLMAEVEYTSAIGA